MLTQAQLELALEEQKRGGEKLGKVLVRLGFVRERDILTVMEGLMAVVFTVGPRSFAVESLLVREIIRHKAAMPLPQAPAWMDGLIHYRSVVVPVMNLRVRLGLPRLPPDERTRIIIFEEPGRQVGVQVDEVGAVTQIQRDELSAAQEGGGLPAALVYASASIDGALVTVLNLEALFDYPEPLDIS
jgi:purine-binding chemotaxis protein CheW